MRNTTPRWRGGGVRSDSGWQLHWHLVWIIKKERLGNQLHSSSSKPWYLQFPCRCAPGRSPPTIYEHYVMVTLPHNPDKLLSLPFPSVSYIFVFLLRLIYVPASQCFCLICLSGSVFRRWLWYPGPETYCGDASGLFTDYSGLFTDYYCPPGLR